MHFTPEPFSKNKEDNNQHKSFYIRDILQQTTGKQDTVVGVGKNIERKTFQKCFFPQTITEAYQLFKNEHTHIYTGKSNFAELRPKYVLYSSDLPQNIHESVISISMRVLC